MEAVKLACFSYFCFINAASIASAEIFVAAAKILMEFTVDCGKTALMSLLDDGKVRKAKLVLLNLSVSFLLLDIGTTTVKAGFLSKLSNWSMAGFIAECGALGNVPFKAGVAIRLRVLLLSFIFELYDGRSGAGGIGLKGGIVELCNKDAACATL